MTLVKSAEVVSYVNGKYTVKYEDDTTDEVDEDLVKSHHPNECTISNVASMITIVRKIVMKQTILVVLYASTNRKRCRQ